jgi:hypothetical protein
VKWQFFANHRSAVHFSVMRTIHLAATLLVPLVLIAQDVKHPLLSSHDRIDGPLGGEYTVEDMQVFADGKVVYVEEGTKALGVKAERSTFEATINSDGIQHLACLLDSAEIRSLPKKVSSKTRPIDFFWQKSLQINRPDKTQEIQIENFYPFLNEHDPVYPTALIELECSLQDIKSEAAKRPRPNAEEDWCGAIRAKVAPVKAECYEDAAQPKIIAGEGWGQVRLGAPLKAVDGFWGTDKPDMDIRIPISRIMWQRVFRFHSRTPATAFTPSSSITASKAVKNSACSVGRPTRASTGSHQRRK